MLGQGRTRSDAVKLVEPVPTVLFRDAFHRGLNERTEGGLIVDSHLSKHLAINLNVGCVDSIH